MLVAPRDRVFVSNSVSVAELHRRLKIAGLLSPHAGGLGANDRKWLGGCPAERALEQGLEESFPGSDPVSTTQLTHRTTNKDKRS
jgi:hypothetical protein